MAVVGLTRKNLENDRMIGIDILRIIMACMIFLRHIITLGGGTFGKINDFIMQQTEICMCLFFVISGYCVNNSSKSELCKISDVIIFYKKRIGKILPLYYLVELFRVAEKFIYEKNRKWLMIFPIRLLGIQIHYSTEIYSGVTWFISCLLIGYFIFPWIKLLTRQFSAKYQLGAGIAVLLLLEYTQILNNYGYRIDMYYNSFFRTLEFIFGVFLSAYMKNKRYSCGYKRNIINHSEFVLVIIASWFFFMKFKALKYLCVAVVVIAASMIQTPINKCYKRLIVFLGKYTFDLFILQDVVFSNLFSKYRDMYINLVNSREQFYMIAILLCIIICRFIQVVFMRIKYLIK